MQRRRACRRTGRLIQMVRSFRSLARAGLSALVLALAPAAASAQNFVNILTGGTSGVYYPLGVALSQIYGEAMPDRSEEHTSELQSRQYLVGRLLLEKKKRARADGLADHRPSGRSGRIA